MIASSIYFSIAFASVVCEICGERSATSMLLHQSDLRRLLFCAAVSAGQAQLLSQAQLNGFKELISC